MDITMDNKKAGYIFIAAGIITAYIVPLSAIPIGLIICGKLCWIHHSILENNHGR